MIRFPGNSAPAAAAGPFGQFGSARSPARMADLNAMLSGPLRPPMSFGRTFVSAETLVVFAPSLLAAFTSPLLESRAAVSAALPLGGAAFASGFELHAPNTTRAHTPIRDSLDCMIIISIILRQR